VSQDTLPNPTDPSLVVRPDGSGSRMDIRVIPRSGTSRLDGLRDHRLLVRVTAAPVDDAANDAVRRLLADALGVPRQAVQIITGNTSRQKGVRIEGLPPDAVRARLGLAGDARTSEPSGRDRAAGSSERRAPDSTRARRRSKSR